MQTNSLLKSSNFLNRKITPLPSYNCTILIRKKEFSWNGEYINREILCEWIPYRPENYDDRVIIDPISGTDEIRFISNRPDKGYLGTATDIQTNIGYHAWEQSESEFVEYKIVEV